MKEIKINFNDYVRLFTHTTTFEQNLVTYIGSNRINIYSPVVVFDKLICEGFRSTKVFEERMDTLPEDFNGESVLDLGCNTGYMLLEIKRKRNPGRCDGVDIDRTTLFIPQTISFHERLSNIDFNYFNNNDIIEKILKEEVPKFDNILCFGVYEFLNNIEEDIIPSLVECVNKRIIIEMANHPHNYKTPEESEKYAEGLKQFGDIKLTILKYQDRPVIEIGL
jgi:SAM-dependent methyltransferase